MDSRSLFLLAIAPVILLLAYIKKKDPNPEPKDLLRKIFIFGCLTIIPVLIFELLYSHLFILSDADAASFANVFFGVALIEEFFKWLVVYLICFKSKHFDETYDAVVYSAYSSLAFACVENVGYIFILGATTGGILGGTAIGILRAFTAVPGHLCHSIVMGYFLGKARSAKAQKKGTGLLFIASLLIPTLTHCIYDYLIEIQSILGWITFFIALVIVCIVLIKHTADRNTPITNETTSSTGISS